MNDDLLSLGKTLKDRRLELGLSIKEVCTKTKINSRYIKCLESGKFDKYVYPVYYKGYLKIYAALLDIKIDNIPAFFDSNGYEVNDSHDDPIIQHKFNITTPRILCCILGIIVIYVLFCLIKDNGNSKGIHDQIIKSAILATEQKLAGDYNSTPQENNRQPIFNNINVENNPLVLIASKETWVRIYDPNSRLLANKSLKEGDTIFVPKEEGLVLTTDNKEAIQIFEHDKFKPLEDLYTHKLKDKFYIKSARYIPVVAE